MLKKFLIFTFVTVLSLTMCSCSSDNERSYEKPVVILPDEHTAYNINGYKTYIGSGDVSTDNSSNLSQSYNAYTGKYYASKNSSLYHTDECGSFKKIKIQNLIIFETIADAEANGYSSCKICCGD